MKISARKPVMFVHFVVCLFANNDGWKCFQEISSKTSWKFVCLFIKRNLLTGTFFCESCITNRDKSAKHKSKKGN